MLLLTVAGRWQADPDPGRVLVALMIAALSIVFLGFVVYHDKTGSWTLLGGTLSNVGAPVWFGARWSGGRVAEASGRRCYSIAVFGGAERFNRLADRLRVEILALPEADFEGA
jgi:hypothetical protein